MKSTLIVIGQHWSYDDRESKLCLDNNSLGVANIYCCLGKSCWTSYLVLLPWGGSVSASWCCRGFPWCSCSKKVPLGRRCGQTVLSPSAPRGKVVVTGGSILVVVRDWKLCETEILLCEKGRKGGAFPYCLVLDLNHCSLAACILLVACNPLVFCLTQHQYYCSQV